MINSLKSRCRMCKILSTFVSLLYFFLNLKVVHKVGNKSNSTAVSVVVVVVLVAVAAAASVHIMQNWCSGRNEYLQEQHIHRQCRANSLNGVFDVFNPILYLIFNTFSHCFHIAVVVKMYVYILQLLLVCCCCCCCCMQIVARMIMLLLLLLLPLLRSSSYKLWIFQFSHAIQQQTCYSDSSMKNIHYTETHKRTGERERG